MTIRIEFKLQDMRIGVFWRRSGDVQHVWLCLVPCVPVHVTWKV